MLYMVNPSEPPKKRKKSRRRNPELLIVNPYSLGGRKEKTMARLKRRRRRRKNPLEGALEGVQESAKSVINLKFLLDNVKLGGAGAIAAVALGGTVGRLLSMVPVVGNIPSVYGININSLVQSVVVATGSAVVGGLAASLNVPFIPELGKLGAQAAIVCAVTNVASSFMLAAQARQGLGSYGLLPADGPWVKEPLGLDDRVAQGMQGYDNYERLKDVIPAITAEELQRAAQGGFGNLGSYERLGDIYGSQRLGSFERENNLGAFVDEASNYGITMQGNQQPADTAALDQAGEADEGGGTVGSYGSYSFGAPGQGGGAGDFRPIWAS